METPYECDDRETLNRPLSDREAPMETPQTLSRAKTKALVLTLILSVVAISAVVAWATLRATNDPQARERIQRLEAIRDSTRAADAAREAARRDSARAADAER